jgi:hypothetical protein
MEYLKDTPDTKIKTIHFNPYSDRSNDEKMSEFYVETLNQYHEQKQEIKSGPSSQDSVIQQSSDVQQAQATGSSPLDPAESTTAIDATKDQEKKQNVQKEKADSSNPDSSSPTPRQRITETSMFKSPYFLVPATILIISATGYVVKLMYDKNKKKKADTIKAETPAEEAVVAS